MPTQTPQLLVSCCLAILTLTAVAVVAVQDRSPSGEVIARQGEFQSLVGGLGFGSAVDLADCAFSFDPRLQPHCSHLDGPIPGGCFLCRRHAGRATGYPYLPATEFNAVDEGGGHATIR